METHQQHRARRRHPSPRRVPARRSRCCPWWSTGCDRRRDVEVRNPTNAATVPAVLQVGNRVEQRVLSADPCRPGVYTTDWTLAPAREQATGATVPVSGAGMMAVVTTAGASAVDALNPLNGREVQLELLVPEPRRRVEIPTPESPDRRAGGGRVTPPCTMSRPSRPIGSPWGPDSAVLTRRLPGGEAGRHRVARLPPGVSLRE